MADLYIDGAAFERMRTNLTRIGETMARPGRDLAALDAVSAGGAELSRRMDEFAEEWGYGVGKLAQFAGTAGQALTQIEGTFRAADDALTRALRGEAP
ncbi:MAG: hypothetical protein ACT4P1_04415 [Sporichthyaceae bacterium]